MSHAEVLSERARCVKMVLQAVDLAIKRGEHPDVILALHELAAQLELEPETRES
jgi:hypothetical protein